MTFAAFAASTMIDRVHVEGFSPQPLGLFASSTSDPRLTTASAPLTSFGLRTSAVHRHYQHHQQRCFHSSRTLLLASNSDDEGSILSSLKRAAKAILPARLFRTKEEQQAAIERKQQERIIQRKMKELFADAPLPFRILAKLASRVIPDALLTMSETIQENQATVAKLLEQAEQAVLKDRAVVTALGGQPVYLSRQCMMQSSSTITVNGATVRRLQMTVSVSGPARSGLAQITASGSGPLLEKIVVQVGDNAMEVSTTPNRKMTFDGGDDGIIEAEIIEKTTRK
jgi:hypothetical protein